MQNPLTRNPTLRLLRTTLAGLACVLSTTAMAQPGTGIDAEKPEKYQNRVLASEKSNIGRFHIVKRFNQNLNTRFNFHFNADNKLSEAIASARSGFRDDFSELLPFYDYTLDATAAQKENLDSVLLKCNNGILLHDLRNDWVDDLYLLMGQAYLYKKEFDSAEAAFQHINYAFQPRSKSEVGFDKPIGSNINEGGKPVNIATPEPRNPLTRLVRHKPIRNDALLWLVRSLIENERMNDAAGLIETLRRDETLPDQFRPWLHELQAYWYYRQEQSDSAAHHLEQALDHARDIREKSRWEFLAAQLYSLGGRKEAADRMYDKAITHTTDLVMEAYARLNRIDLSIEGDDTERIRENLAELNGMSRKAKYEEYLHIIHYAAARLEMKRKKPKEAMELLRRSIAANKSDARLKNAAKLELGDLAFEFRDYRESFHSYDSIEVDSLKVADRGRVALRKPVLKEVVFHLENIRTQDSLRRIARMPESEREAYLKALLKRLRKEKGIQEEETASTPSATAAGSILKQNEPVNLFAANEAKGEWYFYNAGLKTQGFRQFQAKWGKRPNLDNWRRLAAVNAQLSASALNSIGNPDADPGSVIKAAQIQQEPTKDLSMEGLMADIPLTEEQMKASDDTTQASLFSLAVLFKDRLDDCTESARYLDELLDRFPKTEKLEEALYRASLCHRELGNREKADRYRAYLDRNFSESRYKLMLDNPAKAREQKEAAAREATARYEQVYISMIEGRFEEAFRLKRSADSLYGENHWTPQLLYVEAVYHIQRRDDSLAQISLKKIPENFADHPLAPKAALLSDVLLRRKSIEEYLTKLEVKRIPEDSIIRFDELDRPAKAISLPTKAPAADSLADSSAKRTTDPVKKAAVTPEPAIEPGKPQKETAKPEAYTFSANDPHRVVVVLDKVDVVYLRAAQQAMQRFNQERYGMRGLEIEMSALNDDVRLLQVKEFPNAMEALEYLENARKLSSSEILPWMPKEKYRFIPATVRNLGLLLDKKDLEEYYRFLKASLPDNF